MFTAIQTKAGWAVQNTRTYVIVQMGLSEIDAKRIADKLNK